MAAIAEGQPDVILAVPLGAQCPAFLSELANAKAANAGWEPRVYITATCASTLLLASPGANADGIITIDRGQGRQRPGQRRRHRRWRQYRGRPRRRPAVDFGGDYATAYAGWALGELTVEVLRLAAESADVASPGRRSSTRPARSSTAVSSPVTASRSRSTAPTTRTWLESSRSCEYDADTKTYTEVGELVTEFEGATELPG